MSQHDLDIANQGFPATRADLNNALQALGSTNSGATAPSTTYANQLWYDTANNILKIRNEDNDAWISVLYLDQTNDAVTQFDVDNIRIDGNTISSTDTNGNVVIDANGTGHISASDHIRVTGGNDCDIEFQSGSARRKFIGGDGNELELGTYSSSNTSRDTHMVIDSSGNVLVGTTNATPGVGNTDEGISLNSGELLCVSRSADTPVSINRSSNDGSLIDFRQGGNVIGRIKADGGDLLIGTGDTGIRFVDGEDVLAPFNVSTGLGRDNAIDLGKSSERYDDVFATNGTIQTSDQNEKQQIASLTTAEITAAKAISKLFKTFKWSDKVEAKGDAARRHAGVIAQEVQAAMTDAGLTAADYAFWCSNTWWETSTDVPAVEAIAEVLDDDGNVITQAVEAQDAYTRVETYKTSDEAPEGATERTRLGIRYPELLAFIGAATEQRLADLETRVAALEG
jgi:hypothetical protein